MIRMRRICLALALVTALVATGCGDPTPDETITPSGSSSGDSSGRKGAGSDEGRAPEDPAPEFAVTTFEGDRFALGEQRGTPVVLNFWESW
jgi:hypothetical protein